MNLSRKFLRSQIIRTNFKNIVVWITLPGGAKGMAEKTGVARKRLDKKTTFPNR
jgi:hypothetical protein